MDSFLDEDIIKRIRAWATVIGIGISIGFISGAITALKVNPENAKYYFWGLLMLGLITGLFIAIILYKKGKFKEGFDPINRTEDFDNIQELFKDPNKDNNILNLIPHLSDEELINLISFRYPQMLDETKIFIREELINRKIDKNKFLNQYRSIETFKIVSIDKCPRCGFRNYKRETEIGELNCELCGYYEKLDNPDKFVNKLKRAFRFYDDIGLNENKIENEIYKN